MSLFTLSLADDNHTYQFSTDKGSSMVRTETPGGNSYNSATDRHRPFRNPTLLAQVLWVDRAHENAIAEDVAISPDGSDIFAGWWLNNERFSAYVSAGLESPAWAYRQDIDWMLPVAASDNKFAGTASGLPTYLWNHSSPLFFDQIDFPQAYRGNGVSFSGNGNLVASVAVFSSDEAILIVYDWIANDTLFTRSFVPQNGLYGVDFSNDGSTIVVSNYGGLLVYNVPDGDLIGTIYNYSQNTARISGDGSRVIIGTFNGSLFLHEWDGVQYNQAWSINTGHDWVTAVDISNDGSTAAGGTLDFVGGQIGGGKFLLIDSETGDVIIDYDEYGDEVSSVALSATGQYAIASSWGMLDLTYGDVITCFSRDVPVPIFQVLDDVDEVGSIFSVAISDSGQFAAAGGKAVHARTFGNGGMVYSIQIRDPFTNDVAVASIDEPGEFLNPGESAIPTATFINLGTDNASFTAVCTVTDPDTGYIYYESSFDITNLPPNATSVVYFSPDFTMLLAGEYVFSFTANMPGDEDLANNNLSLTVRSWHDIKAQQIIAPFDETTKNWDIIPTAVFRNLGSYYETFDVNAAVYDSNETQVYSEIGTIYGLAPYMEAEVQLLSWTPNENGTYRVEFEAAVPEDFYPDDNLIVKYFEVVNEMIYDDGFPETSIWVNAYPYSINRKFAQRFYPNLPAPFTITNVRFYIGPVNYDGEFDYLAISKESGGLPDTMNFTA
jgi:hypothetical protein